MGMWFLQNKGLYLIIKINSQWFLWVLNILCKEYNQRAQFLCEVEISWHVNWEVLLPFLCILGSHKEIIGLWVIKGFTGFFTSRLLIQLHFRLKRPKVLNLPRAHSLLLIQLELGSHFIKSLGHFFNSSEKVWLPKENKDWSGRIETNT